VGAGGNARPAAKPSQAQPIASAAAAIGDTEQARQPEAARDLFIYVRKRDASRLGLETRALSYCFLLTVRQRAFRE
jgi:hypothetical protein